MHIKEGPEFLKNLPREHNNHVKNIKCLAVEGISAEAMFSPAPTPEFNNATISDHVRLKTHDIKVVEHTQLMEEKGKWFILYNVNNTIRVQYFLNNVLPRLFADYVRNKSLVPEYKGPMRRLGNSS
eukprot:3417247-Ditylum_brightwellii.AAC.1